jgi:flagella basal body P-ring formation protein FlgA
MIRSLKPMPTQKRRDVIILASLAALLLSINVARGAEPRMKQEVIVGSSIVKLGDFIENAGRAADVPVFRAPDPGTTGSVPVARILDVARKHGLTDIKAEQTDIQVSRASRVLTETEVEQTLAETARKNYGLNSHYEISVRLDRALERVHVPVDAKAPPVLSYRMDRASGRFEALMILDDQERPTIVRGHIIENMRIAVPVRTLSRGEIIRPEDLRDIKMDRRELGENALQDTRRIIGLAARRNLQQGRPITESDFTKPDFVERNKSVLISFEMNGISLATKGKALGSGAEGDVIPVMNLQSKRVIQATIIGPNQVRADKGAAGLSLQRASIQ